MTTILSIETSTTVCSVAIHTNGNCIDKIEISEQNAHSSKLTVLIEDILNKNSLQVSDLQAVAISEGPGSYTGLRIGVSVAKGLCYACNLPLIAVNTLQALALTCTEVIETKTKIQKNAIIMPMIDARRMEVYTSKWDCNNIVVENTKALIITENTLDEFNKDNQYYICGDGSEKTKSLLNADNIVFIENITSSADSIGKLAYQLFLHNTFADVAYFEPFYLKEFQATTPRVKIV